MCMVPMLFWLRTLVILLIATQVVPNITEVCSHGWFGVGCKCYCWCFANFDCDYDGTCLNGRCTEGYFGPGCQYADLVFWSRPTPSPTFITDHNDSTCNNDTFATVLTLSVLEELTFSWLRILVRDNSGFDNFTISSSNGKFCKNERHFLVDMKTVDVTCDGNNVIKKLIIEGTIVRNICNIYISGGRNVGLRQKTEQSSNFEKEKDKMSLCQSSNAVDNNFNQEYTDGHCSSTAYEFNGPEWSVILTDHAILHRIHVYNRITNMHRLRGFEMTTFDANGHKASFYVSAGEINIYEFTVTHSTPIKAIKIKGSKKIYHKDRILTLCEVLLFGDTVCSENTYGPTCNFECNCSKTEACSYTTGLCTTGCQPGLYGQSCESRCNEHCLNGICEYVSGKCVSCNAGYFGDNCTIECPIGTYGFQCMSYCAYGCASTCNNIDGQCSCLEEYSGPLCTDLICPPGYHCSERCKCNVNQLCDIYSGECMNECVAGFFGANCSNICSANCDVHGCNHINGKCNQCIHGYVGDYCNEECRPGTFGPECQSSCSMNCASPCNFIDGNCSCKMEFMGYQCEECLTGMYGENCNIPCSERCVGACNTTTGHCLACEGNHDGIACTECRQTFYGPSCDKICPANCLNRFCDMQNGNCFFCEAGYHGDTCHDICPSGSFGPDCLYNCSAHCSDVCHYQTGTCTCKNSYIGPQCTECTQQMYGVNCSWMCSKFCYAYICHADSGECASCIGHRIGPHCDECPAHFYGPLCQTKCPTNCFNDTCNHITGICFSCKDSYSGPRCYYGPGQIDYKRLILIILLLTLVILTSFFCCIQREKSELITQQIEDVG